MGRGKKSGRHLGITSGGPVGVVGGCGGCPGFVLEAGQDAKPFLFSVWLDLRLQMIFDWDERFRTP